jgi:hypothetical protein
MSASRGQSLWEMTRDPSAQTATPALDDFVSALPVAACPITVTLDTYGHLFSLGDDGASELAEAERALLVLG